MCTELITLKLDLTEADKVNNRKVCIYHNPKENG